MSKRVLVTGANGHLGSVLAQMLVERGVDVRASVRNRSQIKPQLAYEQVYADLMDVDSLQQALVGVDTLYQVAAVFKHWSRNPQREIIQPNVEGTRNILRAAAQAGVKRVVYVSSIAAVDKNNPQRQIPADETTWNQYTYGNPYYQSKIASEQLAWKLAKEYGLEMVAGLPGTIIGDPNGRTTPSLGILELVLSNKMPLDINMDFNFVDVADVAEGLIAAERQGRAGERYILANDQSLPLRRIFEIAQEFNPKIKVPMRVSKGITNVAAGMMELVANVTGREPMILRSQVGLYCGIEQRLSIAKAKRELGYNPLPAVEAVRKTFQILAQQAPKQVALGQA